MDCPRCQVELKEKSAEDLKLHGCPTCGGIWLDPSTTESATASFGGKLRQAVWGVSTRARKKGVDTSAAGIPCPACKQPMKQEWLDEKEVAVDVCESGGHGTWFDNGELKRIANAVVQASPDSAASRKLAEFAKEDPDTAETGVAALSLGWSVMRLLRMFT